MSTRAMGILIAGHAAGLTDDQIFAKVQDSIDILGTAYTDDVDRTIRNAFTTDDDFDDLRHELEHTLGMCHDGDDDCAWGEI